MLNTRKGSVSIMRTSGRLRYRALALAACGCFPLAAATGCPASSSNPFEGFIPSESEFQAFNELVENLPTVEVRIVNETTAAAHVEITAGITSFSDMFFAGPFPGEETFLQMVENATILVAPGGTVTGSIKCGEVIAVSVTAPADREVPGFGEDLFGLFISSGNIVLSGTGTAGEEDFTGDLVTTARFVRPDDGDLDCETGTLVIRVETLATNPVYDDATGALLIDATFGTGSLAVE